MLANSLKHSIRITTQPFSKRFLSPTSFCLQRIIEVVPPLGESITEGSVAQWAKEEGSRIEVDDVIVIVETDKVTVDVKSTRAGVLLKRLATDTVIVGKPLYEIDTSDSLETPATNKIVEAPKGNENTLKSVKHTTTRTPSIKFIGKRSLKKAAESKIEIVPTASQFVPQVKKPSKPQTGVDFFSLKEGAWYGRPKLSLKEIDAIESGGAM